MYVLAFDTTAIAASVCLCDDDKLLCCTTLQNGNTHSQTLLPMIEQALQQFSLTVTDIDLMACSVGPGSFTGVRIGVSTLKGLAFGRDLPCVGVSTLEALAYNLIGSDGIICPVMNARRGQVYNALFDCQNGVLTRLCEDRAIALPELDEHLLALGRQPVYLVGDGYDIATEGLPRASAAGMIRSTPTLLRPQNACSVAQLARLHAAAGEAVTAEALTPVYLRPCQAERERAERMAAQAENNPTA